MTSLSDEQLDQVLANLGGLIDFGDIDADGSGAESAVAAMVTGWLETAKLQPVEPAEHNMADVEASTFEDGELEEQVIEAPVTVLAPGFGADRSRRQRWFTSVAAKAAAVLVVVAVALLAVAPVREAVADFLGIGSTRIELTDSVEPETDGAETDGAETDGAETGQSGDGASDTEAPGAASGIDVLVDAVVDIDRARGEVILGRPLPEIAGSDADSSDVVRLVAPLEGGVIQVFADGVTLWVRPAEGPIFTKQASTSQIEVIDRLGDEALIISGEHNLVTPTRRVRAESVVLWIEDDLELRLEGDLVDEALIDRARSVVIDR